MGESSPIVEDDNHALCWEYCLRPVDDFNGIDVVMELVVGNEGVVEAKDDMIVASFSSPSFSQIPSGSTAKILSRVIFLLMSGLFRRRML